MRALSNFVLFTGAAGLMLLVSLNFYALLAGTPNAVSFFSSEWMSAWGTAYLGFGASVICGIVGRLSAEATRQH
ncbi:hypothetical protein [Parvularcula maris]|uniref:Uncharacterized protein n=1 Tax=Parvularcula maris TaxID=2965077 RepID=A0A9X2LAS1_9PROT|nr:hypothetical protein [Parvularcula maris]MCQ8186207.1 hypothetical protein [Parvularcula maris]